MRLENGTSFTGALRVEIGGGVARGTRDLRDGQWHHVAGVLPQLAAPNATDILLYVDGILEPLTSSTASSITTDVAPATIGVDSQSRYFAGVIDEVKIFRRALSAAEITAEYSATNQSAAAWHRRYFGASATNWYADDDGDRGARLLEYALGGEPHAPDAERMLLQAALVNNRLEVRFPRRLAGTHELVYSVQDTTNLINWSSLGTSEVGSAPSELPGFEEAIVQANDAVSGTAPLFVRLQVGFP